jgi:choline-sulfatase
MVMIRQGAYKYIHSEDDPPLLYDLATDPDELQNLAKDPEHEVRCRDFAREVAACWDLAALDSTIRLSQRRRALVGDAMARGDRDHWDYEPQPDYSRIYVRTASGSELADRQIRVPAKGYELPGTSEGGG